MQHDHETKTPKNTHTHTKKVAMDGRQHGGGGAPSAHWMKILWGHSAPSCSLLFPQSDHTHTSNHPPPLKDGEIRTRGRGADLFFFYFCVFKKNSRGISRLL